MSAELSDSDKHTAAASADGGRRQQMENMSDGITIYAVRPPIQNHTLTKAQQGFFDQAARARLAPHRAPILFNTTIDACSSCWTS